MNMLFKQTFSMLWQNKYFAFLSLFGITVTVAVIMAFFIVLENKTENIAPEVNADRMMFLGYYMEESREKNRWSNSNADIPRNIAEKYLTEITSASFATYSKREETYFTVKGIDEQVRILHTDKNFWKAFRFTVLAGNGFAQEAFERSDKLAIISKKLANDLFLGENPIGKAIKMSGTEYRIAGIVDDVPPTCSFAYAQVWTPCFETVPLKDYCKVAFFLKEEVTGEIFRQELDDILSRVNASEEFPDKFIKIHFVSRMEQVLTDGSDILTSKLANSQSENPYRTFYIQWFGLLGAFLLIAISNLTGVNLTRIRERSVEMGIRKAFGAGRMVLIVQLLTENFIVCTLGGILGVVSGYATVQYFNTQLFVANYEKVIQWMEVAFTLKLAGIAMLLIIAFGFLSSAIPVYHLVKSPIISDLKEEITH